uniref:Uncharacterized protein n=1 Tax=Arion vulgaris TaxID=1028688 RepID=A0A0B7ASY1_9EUPU
MQQLQLLLLLVLLLGCSHTQDSLCEWYEILSGQDKCFFEKGVFLEMPRYSVPDKFGDIKRQLMDLLATQSDGVLCLKPDKSKEALECAAKKVLECTKQELRDYMPNPDKIKDIVDTMCNTKNEVDFKCAKSHASKLFNCTKNKEMSEVGNNTAENSTANKLCNASDFSFECLKTELVPCGCATVRAFETVVRDYSRPPSCPQITVPRVRCDSKNQTLFVHNGTGRQNSGSTVVFFVSVVAFIYFQFCST